MSSILKLNVRDLIKGTVVAAITAVLTLLLQIIQNGGNLDPKEIGVVALTATIAYLLKNLSTDDNDKIVGKL